MSVFVNLPISRKLMAAFAAVVAIIFVSSAIIYSRLRVIEEAKDLRVHTTDVLDALESAMRAILDQEAGVHGYVITGNEISLEQYRRGSDAFAPAMRRLEDLASDNTAERRRIDQLSNLGKTWHSEIGEPVVALMTKPETRDDARALVTSTGGNGAVDLIRAKADEIAGIERDRLAKVDTARNEAYAVAYAMTVLGGAASLVVAILMGLVLTRSITSPITRMTRTMAALAKGDTSVEVPGVARGDEIGAMATALQVFKESIVERQQAQMELAHANRVATMGQLSASIAHEINQPIGSAVTNATAALNFLRAQPPNLEEVREALDAIVKNGIRAGDVIDRVRALVKKAPPRRDGLDINQAVLEVLSLTRDQIAKNRVSLQTRLAENLSAVRGDRVQLQQVILNLILNAVEAMSTVNQGPRELLISTGMNDADKVLVTVRDSGPGFSAESAEELFDAFYTTKPNGLGMGLSICRSIIESHQGRLWATANVPRGAVFQFTLPPLVESSS